MKNYRHSILSHICYLLSIIMVALFWFPAIIYSVIFKKKLTRKLNTKTYYIQVGEKQKGPYNISQLKNKNITKDTPVYFYGLPEWTTVEYVKELKEICVLHKVQSERDLAKGSYYINVNRQPAISATFTDR